MGMRSPALRAATSSLFALLVASALFALLVASALSPAAASAAAGQLDPTFGNGGFTILDEPSLKNESLSDVTVLPDGKILGAGGRGNSSGFLLARLNPDGKPDPTFGPEGFRVESDLGTEGSPRRIEAIQLRADGKIVAAGLGRGPGGVGAFEFARYKPNGELDPGFGTKGLTTVPITPSGSAFALDQAPDGKLVAAGDNGAMNEAVVVRLTEEGEPDSTFNLAPKGVRVIDVPGSIAEEAEAVQVLSNGTVLIGGVSENGAFLAELDKNGEPVLGFGTAGIAVHDMGTDVVPTGEIFDIKVLPDGRILATGDALAAPNDEESFVARFKQNGELDPTFGDGGIFRANPTPEDEETESLEVLPDGRILAAGLRGETDLGQNADTWIYRLTSDGHLDPTFGTGGEAFASAVPGSDGAFGLALQPDGKAVIAGDAQGQEGDNLLFGRFLADSGPEPIKATGNPKARRCAGRPATIVGSGKADRIRGTKGADVVVALGGNDRIDTRGGNDVICAGAGNDKVNAGKGRDTIRGEGGRDVMIGGPGTDLCDGGAGRRDTAKHSCERLKKVP
jgi:uncharacterized delta-60 repeat protein